MMKFHKANIQDYISIRRASLKNQTVIDSTEKKYKIVSLENGINVFRLLPPWSSKGFFHEKQYEYNFLPPNNINILSISKTEKYISVDDPIEEVIQKWKSRITQISSYIPTFKAYMNVLIRKDNKSNQTSVIYIMRIPWQVYQWIIAQMCMLDETGYDLVDPFNGFDIRVIVNTVKNRKQYAMELYGSCPLAKEEKTVFNILATVPNLEKMFEFQEEKIRLVELVANSLDEWCKDKWRYGRGGNIRRG